MRCTAATIQSQQSITGRHDHLLVPAMSSVCVYPRPLFFLILKNNRKKKKLHKNKFKNVDGWVRAKVSDCRAKTTTWNETKVRQSKHITKDMRSSVASSFLPSFFFFLQQKWENAGNVEHAPGRFFDDEKETKRKRLCIILCGRGGGDHFHLNQTRRETSNRMMLKCFSMRKKTCGSRGTATIPVRNRSIKKKPQK